MNLDEIRETLFQAMDEQLAQDKAAAAENYKIGQQKIMYNNDARGSLYSGQPTWERAQLAQSHIANLADIQQKDVAKRVSIWDNIVNTLDQINSYNKSAAALSKASSKTSSSTPSTEASKTYLDLYNELYGGK